MTGNPFGWILFTRIVILAIAATSCNLILGYGGMVELRSRRLYRIGGYAVGILLVRGITCGFLQSPSRITAVRRWFGAGVGGVSLRTSGVYFIMITLALAQMMLFVCASRSSAYGGDDGLDRAAAASSPGSSISPDDDTRFYYLCFACCSLLLYLAWRLVQLALRHGGPAASARTSGACARSASRPTATSSRRS